MAFAAISQIPYYLYFNIESLNVLFTLTSGLIAIYIYDNFKDKKYFSIPIIIMIMILAQVLRFDYGYYGIAIMLIFHILKNKKTLMTIGFILMTALFFTFQYNIYIFNTKIITSFICTVLGIIPCLLYNGKQGPKTKYLFYLFYPLHIVFLLFISNFI